MEEWVEYFNRELGFSQEQDQNCPELRNLVDGQRNIGFGLVQATEATPKPGSVELYFKTDDLEGLRSSYISKGIEPTAIVHQPFGSIFSVQPPDGLLVLMLGEPER